MRNTTHDNLGNWFTYDSEGRQFTVNGMITTFDAFNRPVEVQTGSSSYRQIIYSPTGQKFALMNGATVQTYFVLLVAGAQAVYNSGGLQYYRHADWLGTSRLGATTSGSLQYRLAYAPIRRDLL